MGDLHNLAIADRIAEHLRRSDLLVLAPDPVLGSLVAARIRGRLDLDKLATTVELTLLDYLLDEGESSPRRLACRVYRGYPVTSADGLGPAY